MIYLKAYAILFSQDGTPRAKHLNWKERPSWPNDLVEEWNIFKPENWRIYLTKYYKLPNGKKLPRRTRTGDPIFYEVYMWGTSKLAQEYYNKRSGPGGVGGRIYLFPGYDKQGRRKNVARSGWLKEVKVRRKYF